jgi:NAD(P)H-flavin reductase
MTHECRRFLPHPARLAEIIPESADTRTFVLAVEPPTFAFDAACPGQFVMLSLLGHGEAAFSVSSLPGLGATQGTVVVTVRRTGKLTAALFELAPGADLGLRGPFGRGFPDDHAQPTLYVAGGCGLAPLKAAIDAHIARRPPGTRLAIVYGARDPESRIHRAALATWSRTPGVELVECVERPGTGWRGRVGLVTDYLAEMVARVLAGRAALCGPSAMLAAGARAIRDAGLPPADIHVALERHMKCGIGLCGHCYVNHRYVCTDGPVFSLAELQALPDAYEAAEVT